MPEHGANGPPNVNTARCDALTRSATPTIPIGPARTKRGWFRYGQPRAVSLDERLVVFQLARIVSRISSYVSPRSRAARIAGEKTRS